jgi:multidrug efflux pump subunit AcrA (membrane-fusion protein)
MTLPNLSTVSTEQALSPERTTTSEAAAVPSGGPNGSAPPRASRLPQSQRRSKFLKLVLPGVALLLALIVFLVWFFFLRGPQARTDLVTAKVEFKDLQLKIVERGALEARENHDIKCEVKTGSRGAPKIKWVVDNGAYVNGPAGEEFAQHLTVASTIGILAAPFGQGAMLAATGLYPERDKGDLLVVIDDSYLQEQALAKKIDRDNAESLMIAARELHPAKQIAIMLAEKNLEKWIKGDFPQQLDQLEGLVQNSESVLLQQKDRTSWVSRMVKKGYMTISQEESERANLRGDELDLQQKQLQKKVLIEYTDKVNRQNFANALLQAKVDERTAYADMKSKQAVFEQQDALYRDFLDQIRQCKVYAPNSGIVVYSIPEQTRFGAGATQSIIAQGEPVQFGQKMMSIPNLSHMLVNVRIHEAFINSMRSGLPSTVRVEALGDQPLSAHVKSVANVSSPPDWMSPDVKIYQAYVEIDDPVEKLQLKPGLSAVCTIFTEARVEHVLAVPVQAVVSPLSKESRPRCFVLTPKGPEAREVQLGLTDDKYIQIKDGISEGEEVILNPRTLLNDKEKKSGREDEKAMSNGAGRSDGGKSGTGAPRGK